MNAGVAGSDAVLPSMSFPLSLSLYSLQRIPVSQRPDRRASPNGLPRTLSGTGYLQDQDGRLGSEGPAADWSFVRLTGFRSSIRAMELWGVQSCIGACFARSLARVRARARPRWATRYAAANRNQQIKTQKACKARREANNYGASSGRAGKKNIANCSDYSACSAQYPPPRKPVNDIKTSCFKAIHPAREPC